VAARRAREDEKRLDKIRLEREEFKKMVKRKKSGQPEPDLDNDDDNVDDKEVSDDDDEPQAKKVKIDESSPKAKVVIGSNKGLKIIKQ
jgi:hypothetical protein